ncbi:NAD(P)-dependent oxidoreductase [Umezawaea endophytica]|uniref:NAD(P)H-binding protein n=1 Tax=Umezawaea endophytica TaxID=1654476 RepID=A0A9X2VLX6_9PSEU|nr:NAD(P)H-binding protein [Umezawaea endophytica]MCS7478539.1 NAD(P)H-binding protein [Umezawaea endophytica]
MKVVVLGAAGRTGRLVVEEAVRAGHEVTAAVRSPAAFTGGGLVVRADVRDPDSVRAAVAGHDVVVSAIGPSGRHAHGLYSDCARALVSADVDRVVAITSGGVRDDDPNFSFWYRHLVRPLARDLYGDMRLMEAVLRDSRAEWTFVRPARLLDEEPTGVYRVLDGETPKGGWQVPRADVARFVVEELDARRWSKAAPTIAR